MREVPLNVEPIAVTGADPVGMRQVIAHALNADQRFNGDGQGIRAAMRVEEALKGHEGASSVPLEQADWERLREALENPRPVQGMAPYPVVPARRVLPFVDAVKHAPEYTAKPKPIKPGKAGAA